MVSAIVHSAHEFELEPEGLCTYDDGDEARAGVHGDCAQERVLVHAAGRGEDCRGYLVCDDDGLLAATVIARIVGGRHDEWHGFSFFFFPSGTRACRSPLSRDSTHQKKAVNRSGLDQERERVQHARLLATTAVDHEVPAQQSPVHPIPALGKYDVLHGINRSMGGGGLRTRLCSR